MIGSEQVSTSHATRKSTVDKKKKGSPVGPPPVIGPPPTIGPPPKFVRDVVKKVPEGGMVGPVPDSTPPPKEK